MNPRSLLGAMGDDDKRREFANLWGKTQAAPEQTPLPAGEYIAHVVKGELDTSRHGTPGYKLTFQVIEGEFKDRRIWHDCWLTPKALPASKRDLAKLGITELEDFEKPLPPGIRCRVKVALRQDDNGNRYNKVRGFDVLGVDPSASLDFPPPPPEVATS